jgi:hypothetical protein
MFGRRKWLGPDDFDNNELTLQALAAWRSGQDYITVEFERSPGAEFQNRTITDRVLQYKVEAIGRIGWEIEYVDRNSERLVKVHFVRPK